MTISECPGCGAKQESEGIFSQAGYNASPACVNRYYELTALTLSLRDAEFIHQVAVDAYAAQHFSDDMKPIRLAFALIGLYLACQKGYTGKEVQKAHMQLGKVRRDWPGFGKPLRVNALTVVEVMNGINKKNCREQVMNWANTVWKDWSPAHETVKKLVNDYLE